MKEYKCVIACINANGEPDFAFVIVKATEEQYNNGEHYEMAQEWAEEEGYDSALVFDENDPGGRAIIDKFEWTSASIIHSL